MYVKWVTGIYGKFPLARGNHGLLSRGTFEEGYFLRHSLFLKLLEGYYQVIFSTFPRKASFFGRSGKRFRRNPGREHSLNYTPTKGIPCHRGSSTTPLTFPRQNLTN